MATPETTENLNPRPGLMATVRNRRALIVDVNDAGDRNQERLHRNRSATPSGLKAA